MILPKVERITGWTYRTEDLVLSFEHGTYNTWNMDKSLTSFESFDWLKYALDVNL